MKKLILLIFTLYMSLCINVQAKKILSNQPVVSHRVHNEQGERVGTVKRENNIFKLYDMHERVVKNPAEFMQQPENDCYLYNVSGYVIGKCSSTRVILWH